MSVHIINFIIFANMLINVKEHKFENITVMCGFEIPIQAIIYDEFQNIVEQAKLHKIELHYGCLNNYPISISKPKELDISEIFMISLKNVPQDKWIKY